MGKIDQAIERGLEAARCAFNSNGSVWQWVALNAIVDYAASHNEFTIEDVRFAYLGLIDGDEPRGWGHVATKAKKIGVMEPCGQKRVVSSNGMFKTLWRSKIYELEPV